MENFKDRIINDFIRKKYGDLFERKVSTIYIMLGLLDDLKSKYLFLSKQELIYTDLITKRINERFSLNSDYKIYETILMWVKYEQFKIVENIKKDAPYLIKILNIDLEDINKYSKIQRNILNEIEIAKRYANKKELQSHLNTDVLFEFVDFVYHTIPDKIDFLKEQLRHSNFIEKDYGKESIGLIEQEIEFRKKVTKEIDRLNEVYKNNTSIQNEVTQPSDNQNTFFLPKVINKIHFVKNKEFLFTLFNKLIANGYIAPSNPDTYDELMKLLLKHFSLTDDMEKQELNVDEHIRWKHKTDRRLIYLIYKMINKEYINYEYFNIHILISTHFYSDYYKTTYDIKNIQNNYNEWRKRTQDEELDRYYKDIDNIFTQVQKELLNS